MALHPHGALETPAQRPAASEYRTGSRRSHPLPSNLGGLLLARRAYKDTRSQRRATHSPHPGYNDGAHFRSQSKAAVHRFSLRTPLQRTRTLYQSSTSTILQTEKGLFCIDENLLAICDLGTQSWDLAPEPRELRTWRPPVPSLLGNGSCPWPHSKTAAHQRQKFPFVSEKDADDNMHMQTGQHTIFQQWVVSCP